MHFLQLLYLYLFLFNFFMRILKQLKDIIRFILTRELYKTVKVIVP
jgi:hypothetical protein